DRRQGPGLRGPAGHQPAAGGPRCAGRTGHRHHCHHFRSNHPGIRPSPTGKERGMSKIEVKNVYKIFGSRPDRWLEAARQGMGKDELLAASGHVLGLSDISLSIEEGSIYVIMGLSGSGKSTLIRHFNRLIEPSAGSILVDGVDVMSFGRSELEQFRQ